jgi:hypothetical protein
LIGIEEGLFRLASQETPSERYAMATVSVPVVPEVLLEKAAVDDSALRNARDVQERSVLRWGGLAGMLGAIVPR